MDELPDLQSDADVDALMARLRAKVAAAAMPGQEVAPAVERSGNALRDLLAVQEEYASAMFHAMQAIAETLEDMQDRAEEKPNGASTTGAGARDRRPTAGRSGGSLAPRVNGRRRKSR